MAGQRSWVRTQRRSVSRRRNLLQGAMLCYAMRLDV